MSEKRKVYSTRLLRAERALMGRKAAELGYGFSVYLRQAGLAVAARPVEGPVVVVRNGRRRERVPLVGG
jgi:hypothetical protein